MRERGQRPLQRGRRVDPCHDAGHTLDRVTADAAPGAGLPPTAGAAQMPPADPAHRQRVPCRLSVPPPARLALGRPRVRADRGGDHCDDAGVGHRHACQRLRHRREPRQCNGYRAVRIAVANRCRVRRRHRRHHPSRGRRALPGPAGPRPAIRRRVLHQGPADRQGRRSDGGGRHGDDRHHAGRDLPHHVAADLVVPAACAAPAAGPAPWAAEPDDAATGSQTRH